MRPSRLSILAVLSAFTVLAAPLRADDTPAQQAEKLFAQANQLADQGNFAAACPLLEQSNSMDPGIGTQFNLADCYEHTDRAASALSLFREVEKVAREAGKVERQQSAHQRAEALEKVVSRIQVTVPPEVADFPGLVLSCDDKPIDKSDFGRALPFDPGSHLVSASAAGRLPWKVRVILGHEGKALTVPMLIAAAAPPLPPAATSPTLGTQRTLALVSGGAGVVGIAVGSVFGILSIVQHNTYTSDCAIVGDTCTGKNPSGGASATAGASASSSAVTFGNVSTVGFIVGGVGVAGALVLWFTAPKREGSRPSTLTGVDLVPSVGPRSGSMTLRAVW
jgi:hypothetical protein